jgi:ABC-type nitrate/sulfonate/bicarbonate transport system substrate-binding protein
VTREERDELRRLAEKAEQYRGVDFSDGYHVYMPRAAQRFMLAANPDAIVALLDALDAAERRIADETARAMALYLEDVR